MKKGVATAISHGLLAEKFKNREYEYVWASEKGDEYGLAIEPIYKSVPEAALRDKVLHDYLSLLEVLRVGKAREQNLAKNILDGMIFS